MKNDYKNRPQDRKREGTLFYTKKSDGSKHELSIAYSIPSHRCEGCPVYKVDDTTTPTGYYCQSEFLIGAFQEALDNDTIPQSCQIPPVEWRRNPNIEWHKGIFNK